MTFASLSSVALVVSIVSSLAGVLEYLQVVNHLPLLLLLADP
jgi:hypothetical protein